MIQYQKNTLERKDLNPDPYCQFTHWFDEAKMHEKEPEAMALSTATLEGVPSCRMVLLKGFNHKGLVFYTNYESRKSLALQENPKAAALFYWQSLERQVIIEGTVKKVSEEESDRYFATRSRQSQLGAWASEQDAIIASREVLMDRFQEAEIRFKNKPVLRPPKWGGYRIHPERFEFWQGRESRLHDRFVYLFNGHWQLERLCP